MNMSTIHATFLRGSEVTHAKGFNIWIKKQVRYRDQLMYFKIKVELTDESGVKKGHSLEKSL